MIGASFAGVFHEYDLLAWSGPTGFYHVDLRSPPPRNEAKTFDSLYVWVAPSYVGDTMFFSMLAQTAFCAAAANAAAVLPSDRRFQLELLAVPSGVVGAPPAGTVWDLPQSGLFTLEVPTFRTDNGLEGYRFAFIITPAEPGPCDFNNDGAVDLDDYLATTDCLSGPGLVPDPLYATVDECI